MAKTIYAHINEHLCEGITTYLQLYFKPIFIAHNYWEEKVQTLQEDECFLSACVCTRYLHFKSLSVRLCTYANAHVKTKYTFKSSTVVSQMVSRTAMLSLEPYGLFPESLKYKKIIIVIYFVLID